MIAPPERQFTRPLRQEQAALVCRLAREKGGMAIAPSKLSLLEQRLTRRMRATGHADFDTYLAELFRPGPAAEAELQALIEALTTNTTSFFRESAQFDWLRESGLPALIEAGAGRERPLALWSAACSTGAEMWTGAIVLDRLSTLSNRGLRWQVFGSDISTEMLQRVDRAVYGEAEIASLPEEYRRAYLLRSRRPSGTGHLYRIVPDLRRRAQLFQANLVQAPPPLPMAVDVALLRNVLIYFDKEGREAALRHVISQILPGGFLLTGHTESLNPVPNGLVQVAASIYRKT